MMNSWKKTILSVVLLSLALLLDGSLMLQSPAILTTRMGVVSLHFLTIVLSILSLYEDDSATRLFAIIFGFIKDSYYIGFLGIYMVGYFIMVYIIQKARDFFNKNIGTDILLCLIGILFIENFAFFIYKMLSITQMKWSYFIIHRLGATLLIDGLFAVVLYFLITQLFNKIKISE